jgi:hypothetical protein
MRDTVCRAAPIAPTPSIDSMTSLVAIFLGSVKDGFETSESVAHTPFISCANVQHPGPPRIWGCRASGWPHALELSELSLPTP